MKVWWTGLNSTLFPIFIIIALFVFKLNDGPLFVAITDWKLGVDNAYALIMGPGVLDSDIEVELLRESGKLVSGSWSALGPSTINDA